MMGLPIFRLAWFLIVWLLLISGMVACATPIDVEEDIIGVGGSTPETIASSFFEDFNQALRDPGLIEYETRRIWAERLAGYFAPSERVNQRKAFASTLDNFAMSLERLDSDERLWLRVSYTTIELAERKGERATVRLVSGSLDLRHVRVTEQGTQEMLLEDVYPLADLLGQESGVFPVLRVDGRWFMTEH